MVRYTAIFFLIVIGTVLSQDYHNTPINTNWLMTVIDPPTQAEHLKGKSFQTTIPSTVHLILEKAGAIPNPYLQQNYPTLKYISDCNYQFVTNFTVQADRYKLQNQQLVFQGIDTYGQIYLNGVKILQTENAFRKYVVNVRSLLKSGQNNLKVIINSTNERDSKGQAANNMPFPYAQTRKACYQYSWDWAPYLNTIGIWKKVYLDSFNEIKLDYVWIRTRSITKEKAVINFAIALQWKVKDLGKSYQLKIFIDNTEIAAFPARQKYVYYDVPINDPQLWWPNGIGEPFIYDFIVKLVALPNSFPIEQRHVPFGIRTVEIDLKQSNFKVIINGYPVYCKGANYVPPDMFYPRLENPEFKAANTIEALLDAAVDSHFNMIRIWGGGQYESQHFLQLASRKGIMLFYDFMFSDSIYPSTEKFLLNVEQEIKQQIRRARNYPALTLWSGNNEILQGIQDWGWGRAEYKTDYHRLFEVLIPKIIQYESPYIPYIPSSPIYGVGNSGIQRGGDAHYWNVWAGGASFQTYINSVAKFNSQFGTQSLPVWQTIIQAIDKNPSYNSKKMLTHERHNSQFNTLKNYMKSYMKESVDFEHETYQSGLLQAYAIEIAIKAQRKAKPNSFGTLYWQFNDAWPAISWSSIDYYGRWKPLQFMAKRLYPDVAIFCQQSKVYVINDKLYDVNALAIIKTITLAGKVIKNVEKTVNLKANEVQQIYNISDADFQGSSKADAMIYTEIIAGKSQIMSSTQFNVPFKDINLPEASITVQYNSEFNEITIESAGPVVKNLFISHMNVYLKTSNNYFDLVPGHPVKVIIENKQGLQTLKAGLKFRSYREVYTPGSTVKVINK